MENNNIGQVAPAPVQAQTVTVVKNNFWKGFFVGIFTVILLGVLWVVGTFFLLTTTVNSGLDEARAKGALASVKANLASTRAQAELYYDASADGSYAGVCESDPVVAQTLASVKGQALVSNVVCFADKDSYVITAAVKSMDDSVQTVCVDSTGRSLAVAGDKPASDADYVCQGSF